MARLRLKSIQALQRLAKQSMAVSRTRKAKTPAKPLIVDKPAEWRELSDGSIELVMPVRLTNANNGQTKHYRPTAKFRKDCGAWCKVWFPGKRPFDHPVRLVVTRILAKGQQLWDEDSIGRGNAKQLIDSMVACGIFHDDQRKWITNVDYRQDANQRLDYPRVSVRIIKEVPAEKGQSDA